MGKSDDENELRNWEFKIFLLNISGKFVRKDGSVTKTAGTLWKYQED